MSRGLTLTIAGVTAVGLPPIKSSCCSKRDDAHKKGPPEDWAFSDGPGGPNNKT